MWGPVNPPQTLGIRGSNVAVDWDLCTGCGFCLNICPSHLYEWKETVGHPTSEKKPFPTRETECIQCFQCEKTCSVNAIRVTYGGASWENAVMLVMFAQIFVGTGYGTIVGSTLGLQLPQYVGWILFIVSLPFWLSTLIYFPKKGRPQEGKKFVDTTVVVDSGLYSIVRHPQVLGCILLMAASVLVSQHWLALIIAIPTSVWLYTELKKEEKGLVLRFGDPYHHYMQRVPRMNLLLGVLRLVKRRREN